MILFCDIDGVLIPGRAYYMPGQTWPLVTKFDPCVVGMVNRLCKDLGAKVVIHSNWRGTEPRRISHDMESLDKYFIAQGILPEYMHDDPLCPRKMTSTRWYDIELWLGNHPEETEFFVLEDTSPPPDWKYLHRVIQTDFDEGLTISQYLEIRYKAGMSEDNLITF
jgi:hypothetical protein